MYVKIGVISKADSFGGGASRIAETLVNELNQTDGYSAIHINAWRGNAHSNSVSLYGKAGLIVRVLKKIEHQLGLVDFIPFEIFSLYFIIRRHKVNLLHFHDLSSAISPVSLFILSKLYPTFWTLHDMSPLTAGCLYISDCDQWTQGCGNCPQIGIWPLVTKIDKTKYMRKWRNVILKSELVGLITPSYWLKDLVSIEIGNRKTVLQIENGVSNVPLNEIDVMKMRESMNLDMATFTIIVMAGDLNDSRKGFQETIHVLEKLYENKCKFQVILVGHSTLEALKRLPPVELYISGYIQDHTEKMKIITSADVFLFMSRQDNQPLTVLEALVQGTSVVGYPTGGVREIDEVIKFEFGEEEKIVATLQQLARLKRTSMERNILANSSIERYGVKNFLVKHIAVYESRLKNA